jgi:hypothetical protein
VGDAKMASWGMNKKAVPARKAEIILFMFSSELVRKIGEVGAKLRSKVAKIQKKPHIFV